MQIKLSIHYSRAISTHSCIYIIRFTISHMTGLPTCSSPSTDKPPQNRKKIHKNTHNTTNKIKKGEKKYIKKKKP